MPQDPPARLQKPRLRLGVCCKESPCERQQAGAQLRKRAGVGARVSSTLVPVLGHQEVGADFKGKEKKINFCQQPPPR